MPCRNIRSRVRNFRHINPKLDVLSNYLRAWFFCGIRGVWGSLLEAVVCVHQFQPSVYSLVEMSFKAFVPIFEFFSHIMTVLFVFACHRSSAIKDVFLLFFLLFSYCFIFFIEKILWFFVSNVSCKTSSRYFAATS